MFPLLGAGLSFYSSFSYLDMTAREALDKLDDIRIAKNQIGPRILLCPVQGDAEHRKILSNVGIKSIPRVLLS